MDQIEQKPVPESHVIKTIFKVIFYTVFLGIFIWVCGQLFFQKQIDNFFNKTDSKVSQTSTLSELSVIYPQQPDSLEPTLNSPDVRQRLVNVYEPLVKVDSDLTIRPSLALSWGLIDDTTWQFNLRKNIKFHDGTDFDVNDALVSIRRAMSYSGSELVEQMATIKDMQIIDGSTFQIKTKSPDPLLLQKLSTVLVIPSEYENKELIQPIGTGSYKYDSWDKEKGIMRFVSFENYWGKKAKFANVKMLSITDKSDRVNSFLKGDAELLTFVPSDTANVIKEQGFNLATVPTLEVQSLMFNSGSKLLKDPLARQAVVSSIDKNSFVSKLGDYVKPIDQFVSNGIFGFNPNISSQKFDLTEAQNLISQAKLKGKTLQLHLPLGLDILGDFVRKQMENVGVNVIVSYLESDKFLESLNKGKADIYFLGFKSELGDAVDFLSTVVSSNGVFNTFNYKNANVDYLINLALTSMNPDHRRDSMQEAMKIIVQDDVFGIPLFEYETIFAFDDKISFTPRLDGLVYFDEITAN